MNEKMICFARQLRRNQTDAEKRIWKHLRSKQLNSLKFRRQQPVGSYILDFVCIDVKLIVELDGSQHIELKEKDIERNNWLRSQGFTVLRFWNNEVMGNITGVLDVIYNYCEKHPLLTLLTDMDGLMPRLQGCR